MPVLQVTGSNCVNVFLGLGLPWTIGAIYWKAVGANNDTTRAWAATHSTGSAAIRAATQSYRDAGTAAFVVEAVTTAPCAPAPAPPR